MLKLYVSPRDEDLLDRPINIQFKHQTSGNYHLAIVVSGNGYHRRNSDFTFPHMVIAERVLGRPLERSECVHHINGCSEDCRRCNLLICTLSYHAQLHGKMSQMWIAKHFERPPNDAVGKEIEYKGKHQKIYQERCLSQAA